MSKENANLPKLLMLPLILRLMDYTSKTKQMFDANNVEGAREINEECFNSLKPMLKNLNAKLEANNLGSISALYGGNTLSTATRKSLERVE